MASLEGSQSKFDACWDDSVLLFWAGLKRRAVHTQSPKQPLALTQLLQLQKDRALMLTAAGLRDAAPAGVCVFGIRMISEGLDFDIGSISFDSECASCRILKQKNDPLGKGQTCWIPRLTIFGDLCPVALLERWVATWRVRWTTLTAGSLFSVTSSSDPRPISYESWRKVLAAALPGSSWGSHSLRKGGALWYRDVGLPEDIIQSQGGWSSRAVMEQVYTVYPELACRSALIRCAAAGRPLDEQA
jgi:hypothetical protein